MGKVAHLRNLRKENSSGVPAHCIYQSIYPISRLLLVSQIVLNNSKPVELAVYVFEFLSPVRDVNTKSS